MIRSIARQAMVAGIVGAIALSACSDDDDAADSTTVSTEAGSTVAEAPTTEEPSTDTDAPSTEEPSTDTDAPSTDTDAVPEATSAPTPTDGVVTTDAPPAGDTTPPSAEDAALTISISAFSSAEVTAGDEFTILNEDGFGHTVTNRDGVFDVTVGGGETATLTIERAGEYEIFCRIHDSMSGTITVV